jgi:hypothetical protein
MKLTRTGIGLIIAVIYLGIFSVTVYLTLFDNREGSGTFFPGMVTLPWSLPLETVHEGTPHDLGMAMLKRLPGALLNAGIILYVFRRLDKGSRTKG